MLLQKSSWYDLGTNEHNIYFVMNCQGIISKFSIKCTYRTNINMIRNIKLSKILTQSVRRWRNRFLSFILLQQTIKHNFIKFQKFDLCNITKFLYLLWGPKCDGFCEISPYFRTAKISVVAISSLINMSCKVHKLKCVLTQFTVSFCEVALGHLLIQLISDI